MGSSPPRGVFTSNPQNCSPASVTVMVGDEIVKRVLGVMVMVRLERWSIFDSDAMPMFFM